MNLKALSLALIVGITGTVGMFFLRKNLPVDLPTPMSSVNSPVDTATTITDMPVDNTNDTVVAADALMPDLQLCNRCKMQRLVVTTSYSNWVRLGNQRLCVDKYAFGVDLEVQRTTTLTAACSNCDFSLITESTELLWECNGFNGNPL